MTVDYENQSITESMKTCLNVNFGLTDSDIWSTLKSNSRFTNDENYSIIKERIINEIEKYIDDTFPLDERMIELFDDIEIENKTQNKKEETI